MGSAMSGYLESPITDKEVVDGVSKLGLRYGAASMQGWRNSQEDAVSCEPEFTEESALFGVYDGHGGPEVALYVAKYLPILLKTQYDFTSGKTEHALREAFLAVDKQIKLEETADELQTLAGTKADDEDEIDEEEKMKECVELNEEAQMPLADILAKYKKQMQDCIEEEFAEKAAKFEGSGKGKKPKPETEEEQKEEEGATAVADPKKEEPANGSTEEESPAATTTENGAGRKTISLFQGEFKEIMKQNIAKIVKCTANGDVAEEDEDDPEYQEEEEDSAVETDEDDEDDDDESGSDESDEEDPPPYDEREGWGSGTTACVAVVRNGHVTVANVGDSRCVVCVAGKAKDLSEDHKPESEAEKARVEKAGGRVTKDGRINGGLNMSRALGDHQYKNDENLSAEEQVISPVPDIQTHKISPEDEFLLIACDGIWNVLSSEEAVAFVREHLEEAKSGSASSKTWLSDISTKLLDSCIAADTSGDGTGCDNMTAVIVLLNQDQPSKRKLDEEAVADTPESKKSKAS